MPVAGFLYRLSNISIALLFMCPPSLCWHDSICVHITRPLKLGSLAHTFKCDIIGCSHVVWLVLPRLMETPLHRTVQGMQV